MKKINITIGLKKSAIIFGCILMSLGAMAQQIQVGTSQYLLYNVGTGQYLSPSFTLVNNASEAAHWRFLGDIGTTSPLYSEGGFLNMYNYGFGGWKVGMSGRASALQLLASTTTNGAIKFGCQFGFDTRYLNADTNGNLSAASSKTAYNDWLVVPATDEYPFLYRILTVEAPNGHSEYTIGYQSVNIDGSPIELSGYVALPTSGEGGPCTADHMLISTHYTMTKNSEVPSQSDPFDALTFTLSTNKPVMIEPDYLGYGLTGSQPHPYCAPDIMAKTCVDMLPAVYQLLEHLHQFNAYERQVPTYGIGYSQGGAIILAVQRYIENSPELSDEMRAAINYSRTACGAGPYNTLATLSQYMHQDDLTMPIAAPLLVLGMVVAYPDVFEGYDVHDAFSEAFNEAGIIEAMQSCNYTIDELNAMISDACGGAKMSLMLSEQAKDMNSEMMQRLQKALGMSDLTRDWTPEAEIWFFHNTDDDVVPYLNTISAYNAFLAKGCNVSLYTTGVGMSHLAAAIDFMARMILGGYNAPQRMEATNAPARALRPLNPDYSFYWHRVAITASEGGSVYATGTWRLPLSEDEYTSEVDVPWVIAGLNNSSSCRAWAKAEEGYRFAGWYSGEQLLDTTQYEARIWSTTDVQINDDGIVSGANYYPLQPTDTIRAVFVPVNATSINANDNANVNDNDNVNGWYDVLGRPAKQDTRGVIISKGKKRLQ